MAQTKPMRRYLLPGLSAAIALSLTATFLSGNTFLNSWFNDSFNRTTINNNGGASDPGDGPDASPSDRPEAAPLSVTIEPIITVDVNVLPEITVQNVYQCPKISQEPSSVPEPRAVVGLGVMGLVLSGMMSLGKGLH